MSDPIADLVVEVRKLRELLESYTTVYRTRRGNEVRSLRVTANTWAQSRRDDDRDDRDRDDRRRY